MKQTKKGFTLIELIVVMAIIAILVLIAAPKFMGYTEKAKLTQVINDIKVSEKAAEQYYLQHDLWPRDQTATPYTDEQLTLWVDDFRNLSGDTITLEDGKYYDVDWNLMTEFMSKPDNYHKYIIQNPVGDIYYANNLTPAGEQTKFAGDNQIVESLNVITGKIAAGELHTLIIDETGQLWSFGSNRYGQLGNSTNISTNNPNPTPTKIMSGTKFISVSAGSYHSFALDETGQLWSFGYNRYGQLGRNSNIGTENANPIPTQVIIGTKVVSISTEVFHTSVIDETGQLWSFGQNRYGQLGNSTNIGILIANPTPTKIMNGIEVVGVDVGYYHTLAIDETGQLWSFGLNDYGQLGNLTNSGTSNANPIPTKIMTGTKISNVSAGTFHTLVMDETKQIWSFGYNNQGQLGHSLNSGTSNANPISTKIMTGTKIINISAGGFHTLAIDETGKLWSFGSNDCGQLGNLTNSGNSTANSTPTNILTDVTFISVSAGGYHTLILDEAGQLLSFGLNNYGQLGNNSNNGIYTANPIPTQIMNGISIK